MILWHQVMRPTERGWRGKEGESEREDVLCMCTLHVTTREKGGYVDMIGGVERASECIEFKEKWNSSPETGFDQVKVPYRGQE